MLVGSKTAEDHLEWCGLVESKVRHLISSLEKNEHIALAHVNPKRFECSIQQTKTAEFCSMWFVGMEFVKMDKLNVDLTESIQTFTDLVHSHGVCLHKGGMEIAVRHLKRKNLGSYLGKSITKPGNSVAKATTKSTSTVTAKSDNQKRMPTEAAAQPQRCESAPSTKRQRTN